MKEYEHRHILQHPTGTGSDLKALQVWLLNDLLERMEQRLPWHSCCKRFLIHLSLCIGNTKDELRLDECVYVAMLIEFDRLHL